MVLDCCGEHSDYGLLTLVNQAPHVSALQVRLLSQSYTASARLVRCIC